MEVEFAPEDGELSFFVPWTEQCRPGATRSPGVSRIRATDDGPAGRNTAAAASAARAPRDNRNPSRGEATMKHPKITWAAALLGLAAAGSAMASPAGRWQVDHFDFVTQAWINEVDVCLGADGSTRGEGWHGSWSQSGNSVMARAVQSGKGNSADFMTLVDDNDMSGFNQSWTGKDTAGGFYTTSVWTRLNDKPC
jgi:hypothetical protein